MACREPLPWLATVTGSRFTRTVVGCRIEQGWLHGWLAYRTEPLRSRFNLTLLKSLCGNCNAKALVNVENLAASVFTLVKRWCCNMLHRFRNVSADTGSKYNQCKLDALFLFVAFLYV